MVPLGEGAVSYERGTPVGGVRGLDGDEQDPPPLAAPQRRGPVRD